MASQAPRTSHEVYLLPLTDLGAPDVPGQYIYLPPPTDPAYVVRFAIEGTSSICRQGSLWVSVPAKGKEFDRNTFREFNLHPDFNRTIEIDVSIVSAGAFAFYTTFTPLPEFSTSDVPTPEPTRTPLYYIDVSPRLMLNGEHLPLDALSTFSVISKFMGTYPHDWEKHLKGIGQRGYNMVHFTPLMERGASNSPYSIRNQLAFDSECFPEGENDIVDMVSKMEKEHGLLGMTDVVWNHTSPDSPWLETHPEVGYNLETAPWLESAFELDTAIIQYSGSIKTLGLPSDLSNEQDLRQVVDGMRTHVMGKMKLWEYYVIHVERNARNITEAWATNNVSFPKDGFGDSGLGGLEGVKNWSLKQKADFLRAKGLLCGDRLGERFRRKIDSPVGAALLTVLLGRYEKAGPNADLELAQTEMSHTLDEMNLPFYREYDGDSQAIMQQVFDRVKYIRLDPNGPKVGTISEINPLVEVYFTRLPDNLTTKKHNPRSLALVNNGWVMNVDVRRDNAGASSRAYLRREVIVWSDCVKLRYGSSPKDNPFLWDLMAKYTRLMAKYFAGLRIDNCHSTPMVLAEYLLDEARKVRPNLAVFAELFTGSEEMDFVYVERLGISSLIREAMKSWSTEEMSRLVHKHGGIPIGSFEVDEVAGNTKALPKSLQVNGTPSFKEEAIRRIKRSPVHALFMDCSHDNEVPAQTRDARDTLPNGALVSMCACATGSVMGYDELYPKLVDLVHEKRLYASPYSTSNVEVRGNQAGIGGIKKLLNRLHVMMGQDGYDETHIHHEGEYVTVHRVHPKSRKGVFLIAHTAYPGYGNGNGGLSPVHLTGTKAKSLGSWRFEVDDSESVKQSVLNDKSVLKGLPSRVVELYDVGLTSNADETVITLPDAFPPGSIALFETWIPGAEHSEGLDIFTTSGAKDAFAGLTLVDLNFALYRSEPEERDSSDGADGVYTIPNYGPLRYAGLQGWWSVLRDVIKDNNLGHPICQHLRDGQWALDYIVGRLERVSKRTGYERLGRPAAWLKQRFDAIRRVPNFLLPRYFALVVKTAYGAAWDQGIRLMAENVREGQWFLQSLAMTSVQYTGFMKSASLYPQRSVPSLAAGLPHFSSDWARCWGRDIFISLRGLFLATGRYAEAREHILAFASVLKHGMIPNLLSGGKLPRYNSRDSVWFFLQNIQDYTKMVPGGLKLLQESVLRRFLPYDDTYFEYDDPRAYAESSTIEDIVQEALQRHASGMSFRESNAGGKLDEQMSSEGFNIDIKVDWQTGIIFGGSQYNCGTWMDKMGESQKAGSKGVPGTPRDGAAVEITGLLYSTLIWVTDLSRKGHYKYGGVLVDQQKITFEDWASRIKGSFERCYYVPVQERDDYKYDVNTKIVNRRGIYKDLYRSGKEYEDYQLRANFPIAMTVAPQLFTPENALQALSVADSALLGPTGMATLDPSDLNYRPYYINSEDSTDFATSKGRNYHQGPEWLWPTGYFLRALLKFDLMRRTTKEGRTESFQQITRRLAGCKKEIAQNPWAGLPELTQRNGEFCPDSNPTQAWSSGCLIDLFMDARELSVE